MPRKQEIALLLVKNGVILGPERKMAPRTFALGLYGVIYEILRLSTGPTMSRLMAKDGYC